MNLLVKAAAQGQTIASVTPASAGWQHVGFEAVRLSAGDVLSREYADAETCVVVVAGRVTLAAGETTWADLCSRQSPFDDAAPYALYVPPRMAFRVQALGDAEIALCTAPAAGRLPARLIHPETLPVVTRGREANTRYVRDILPQEAPAESLLVVEVRTPSGHSSSYPPHKHDRDAIPEESALEETYYHRIDPPQGFAVQRVYTDARDIDQTMAVENGDVVLVPRGYHPVIVPYGYQSYYLNVMAGPKRTWHFANDPAHAWIVAPAPAR